MARDPDNQLLARGPQRRLVAESIRDSALAASGLLNPAIGGPSVKPYQPAGLWEQSGTGKTYKQDTGGNLYRRSLYTFWRRTSPPPSMITFDAMSREVCTAKREVTTTPLQSLVLLNAVRRGGAPARRDGDEAVAIGRGGANPRRVPGADRPAAGRDRSRHSFAVVQGAAGDLRRASG
jgi:hypothetical protein